MTIAHLYKSFESQKEHSSNSANEQSDLQIQEEKLESFEDGYKSGWDDAVAAQQEENLSISKELGNKIQEISFTYHEARSALSRELREIIEPVLNSLFPMIAKETLPSHIAEQVSKLASDALHQEIEIVTSSSSAIHLNRLCESVIEPPFVLVPDENLLDEQIFVRVGRHEREIDFDSWISEIHCTLEAFFANPSKEKSRA